MGKAINRFCIPFLFALLACTNETKQLDIALQQAKDNKGGFYQFHFLFLA